MKFINMGEATMVIPDGETLRVYFKDWCYVIDHPKEVEELKDALKYLVGNKNWWCIGD